MKNILLTISFILVCLNAYTQVPQTINFQAQARGSDGKLLESKPVKTRFSVLETSSTGTPIYIETHDATTDNSGLYNLSIGGGTIIQGDFTTMNWSIQPKFLKVEVDAGDGTGFKLISTFQLASVPFAFYAAKADTSMRDSDKQSLSLTGNELTISNGNSVILPTHSQWSDITSGISYDKRVGIGTTTPRSFLDVWSTDGNSQYSINASNTNSQGQAGAAFWNNANGWLKMALLGDQVSDGDAFGQPGQGTVQILSQANAKDMLVGTLNNQDLIFGTNNFERLRVSKSGQISAGSIIESTLGGFKFPDGTIQTSASTQINSVEDGSAVSVNKSLSISAEPGTTYTRVSWRRLQNNATDSLLYHFIPGQWYYFAVSKKSTGEAIIYINGKEMFKGNHANEAFNHSTFNIAASFFTSYGNFFNGTIDGIRVSNISKSTAQINQYWVSGTDFAVEANTFALWRFDEGVGSAINSSIGSYPGNLVGNPQWVTGKFGNALSFDGIDDYGFSNLTLPTANVTYETWVKFNATSNPFSTILQPYGMFNLGLDMAQSTAKNNEGLILQSPNGNCWKITIDNSGNLVKAPISCSN